MKVCGKKNPTHLTTWIARLYNMKFERKVFFGPCPTRSRDFELSWSEVFGLHEVEQIVHLVVHLVRYIHAKFQK